MLRNLFNSVVGKIILGYVMIITVALTTTIVSLYIINKSNKSDTVTTEVLFPSIIKLKNAEKLCSDSYMIITRWVNQPDDADKKTLENLINNDFVNFKNDYVKQMRTFEDDNSIQLSKKMLSSFESLIESNKKVLKVLHSQEVFAEDSILNIGLAIYEKEVKPKKEKLLKEITHLSEIQNSSVDHALEDKMGDSQLMIGIYIFSILLFVLIGIVATYLSKKMIVKPIIQLSELISDVSKGHLNNINIQKSKDEIGGMVESIESMIDGMKEKAIFAEKIGEGKYDTKFTLLSNEDKMGISLVKMRDNLLTASEDDFKRNWATEGLAKFSEILRSNNDNNSSTQLYDKTIANLVKYIGANQGGLFIVNEDDPNNIFIELVACYAYERKKMLEKRIEIGEGILGQTYLEEEYVYLTDVPDDYVHITSGLGDVTASSIICFPLKVNDKVYGLVELASFKKFEMYQIDFLNKLGENIASTIASAKINDKTYKLLEISKIQTEEMSSQEEELRQNLEELQATQEEMERKEKEYKSVIENLQNELNKYKN